MRKSLLLLAAVLPLAAAPTWHANAGPATGTVATTPSVPLDLEAIPIQPVAGPLSVQGVGSDDEDQDEDAPAIGRHGGDRASAEAHEHDGSHEGSAEMDE